jgi:hypothetical protein
MALQLDWTISGRTMMLCFAVGPLEVMQDKEVDLKKQGYQAVAGPEVRPMQYTVMPEHSLRGWTFKLLWNEPTQSRQYRSLYQ